MTRETFSVLFASLLAGLLAGWLLSGCGTEVEVVNRWPCDGGPEHSCKEIHDVCSSIARDAPTFFLYVKVQLDCDEGYAACLSSYDAGVDP